MNRFTVLVVGASLLAAGCGSGSSSPSAPSQGTTTTSTFTVPLSSANEIPAITNADAGSTGTAIIALTVTRDTSSTITSATMNFQISVAGFPAGTTVTKAHVHNGGAGTNGGIVVDTTLASGEMTVTNGSGSITKNGINVPADRVAALLSNPAGHYFNVHTALNPDGAVRGQLGGGTATFDPGAPVPY
jgi:hypothetical protein